MGGWVGGESLKELTYHAGGVVKILPGDKSQCRGVAKGGGSWGSRDAPFVSSFKQTTYNRW